MKALVAHHYWNRPGDGELYNAALCRCLHEFGFDVAIAAVAKPLLEKYPEWFSIDLSFVREVYSLPLKRIRNVWYIPAPPHAISYEESPQEREL